MGNILLGCIADDFTGAGDAASFLVKGGMNTILINGIPERDFIPGDKVQAVVIALKCRAESPQAAVRESLEALKWLKRNKTAQIYIKYCSTFDSTHKGNIGPVVDAVMEQLQIQYTILCPALPVNGRTVRNGILYVDGQPLHESPMKNHPLNPMWASDIGALMKPQGKYECFFMNRKAMKLPKDEIIKQIETYGAGREHFYIVPDYAEEEEAGKLAEVFGTLPLLTGGSGLLEALAAAYTGNGPGQKLPEIHPGGKAVILSGSCSRVTLEQIAYYQKQKGWSLKISSADIMKGRQTADTIWKQVESSGVDTVLVYSSDVPEAVRQGQRCGKEQVSAALEQVMASLAQIAQRAGFGRIIVAGGETSGAVMHSLGYRVFCIGESIAPGVPVMTPVDEPDIRLVLKSGNFGTVDFFERAAGMTGRSQSRESDHAGREEGV